MKHNADNRLFTSDDPLPANAADAAGAPGEIIRTERDALNQVVAEAPQFDDLTTFCPERKEPNRYKEMLRIEAKNENLDAVNDFVDAFLETHDCPMKTQMQKCQLCLRHRQRRSGNPHQRRRRRCHVDLHRRRHALRSAGKGRPGYHPFRAGAADRRTWNLPRQENYGHCQLPPRERQKRADDV